MGNLERRFLGHTDLPLTPMGHEQARRVALHLKEEPIDAIYSSDLRRAMQTAAPLAEMHALPVIPCEALREIYAGEWENDSFTHINATWGEEYHTFRSDIGHSCPPGGESAMQVGARVFACVSEIAGKHPDSTVLIASHATAIGMFTSHALGLDADHARQVSLPSNASCTVFEYHDGVFVLRRYSDDSYLGDVRLKAPPTA